MTRHRLLQRQCSQHLSPGASSAMPEPFLDAVSKAYEEFDADRALLERSLELSSAELLQANTELRAIVQAFPDLFLRLDREGRVTSCRARTNQDLFLSVKDLVGRRIQDIPNPAIAATFADAISQIQDGASLVTVEYALTIGAEERHYEARLLPILESGILAIVRNITEQKRAEASLRERETQLRQAQKMEAIGQLAGGIAHDFNNLLTAMLGFSALLRESLQGRPADLHRLEQIHVAATRAAALTRQLLAYGRKQVLENRPVNLNGVVNGTTQLAAPLLGPNTKLRCALDDSLGEAYADPGQIEQVLLNLILNARDAMSHGGTLTIETANIPAGPSTGMGRGSKPGDRVMLSVSDTGSGMDAATKARIFEPFFTTKDKAKGSGLGLSTVHGIVKQSGGDIEVESEPGKGSTFRVFLPRAASEPEASDSKVIVGSPGRTILLVDDEDLVRELAREILTCEGHNVLGASCASEALSLVAGYSGEIELMITDVVMPGVSGVDLAASLKRLRPNAQVIYMSGYPGEAITREGVFMEGTHFLQKPFTAEALSELVRDLLDSRQPTS